MSTSATEQEPKVRPCPSLTTGKRDVKFRNGYLASRAWLAEHAVNKPFNSICHSIVFADRQLLGRYSRAEVSLSCRLLALDDSVAGEQKGIVMALAHFRETCGWQDKSLVEIARHVAEYDKTYFLLL